MVLATHPSAPRIVRLAHNTGFAGGIAAGVARVRTPYVAWLNDDARPDPGWLATLDDELTADTAAVASRLQHDDGTVQSFGVALTPDAHGYDIVRENQSPFAFCGGAALLRVAALRSVGGVPAGFFCYYEDTDTAWRLRLAGWRIGSAPDAIVYHRHGASTVLGSSSFHRWNERNRLLMLLCCAPARVATTQCTRFVARTLVLAVRRPRTTDRPPNHRVRTRVRIAAEVLTNSPGTLLRRHRVSGIARVGRGTVWRGWAGR